MKSTQIWRFANGALGFESYWGGFMPENLLEARVGEALRAKGWTVSAAESCTGGLLMHRLTNIPGSSAYVQGGVVAYSYESKETVLRVRPETLLTYGAVSEQTAVEMVRGVLALFGTDVAVSITGIAGPGGGMPGKPVGLTYLALATKGGLLRIEHHIWSGDREAIKHASADCALEMILEVVEQGNPSQ
jgi:PncC family amidohydrolase